MKLKVGFFVLIGYLFSCNSIDRNEGLSIFKYNESNGIATLDPAFAKDKATIWATSQIFNSLVRMDKNLVAEPSIAKKWEISEDGLVYTFFLRNNVFFHDHKVFKDGNGRKVTSSDFCYSFNRLLSKELASPGSWVLNHVDSFYAENDSVFVIQLNTPFPPFLSLLSMQYCSVVPYELADLPTFRSNPIGTGPFKFQYWKEGVKLVLRKNPNYFEFEDEFRLPYLDAVAITFIKDRQSEFLNFLQGKIHFISGLDASYKDQILDAEGFLQEKYRNKINLEILPFLNTEYLGFLMDGDSEISRNIKLRQAINFAIDKKSMIKYLRNNIGIAAEHGFVPFGMTSFSKDIIGYDYNIEEAQNLLKEAGFPHGEGLSPIILNTTDAYLDLCEYIQNQLQKIGIHLKIEVNPSSTHRQMVASSKVDFFRASWIADYPDPENYLSLFYSKNLWNNGLNTTHFYSEEYDTLYEKAVRESDVKERKLLYQRMDQIIVDNAVIVPLYYDEIVRFYHNNISGFESNAQNSLNLLRVIIN